MILSFFFNLDNTELHEMIVFYHSHLIISNYAAMLSEIAALCGFLRQFSSPVADQRLALPYICNLPLHYSDN